MSHQEEAPQGKTQDTLERLCLSAGLGTPRGPPGRAGGSVWGEGSLGISAQTAASATWVPDQADEDGWMDGHQEKFPRPSRPLYKDSSQSVLQASLQKLLVRGRDFCSTHRDGHQ
ncbi:hypothetical protein L3Q82_005259 [Scortum barcoo]|uniref:Uncharacterized protein n=1 Tax=Scortum barcoo TaxID=214431 RepID=A0ACB8V9Z9_9TELE|nr:hypothetical protein L3Q82_005259 [Scortum barcoo]